MNFLSLGRWFRIAVAVLLLVLTATVLASGTAVADNGEFEVEIDSIPDDVDEGADLDVEVTIENVGDTDGTQTITLEDSEGDQQDTVQEELDSGESNTTTLTWEGVPGRPTVRITPTVRSSDDVESEVVDINWSAFEIRNVDVEYVSEGRDVEANFNVDIQNPGTEFDIQKVYLSHPNQDLDPKEVPIEGEDSNTTTTFENVNIPHDAEDHTYEVRTDNDTQTVDVDRPAVFTVSIDRTSGTETGAEVVATIENEGDFEDTQTVTSDIDGDTTTKDVTLGEGQQETVTFRHYDVSPPTTVKLRAPQLDSATTRIGEAEFDDGPTVNRVSPQYAQSNDEISVDYTADDSDIESVSLEILGPDGETIVDTPVDPGVNVTATTTTPDEGSLSDGSYDVRIVAENDFGQTEADTLAAAFEVSTITDSDDVEFSEDQYRSPAGDFVEIDITADDLNEAYILIGGDRESSGQNRENYLDVLHVDGDATFVINTRLVGTDRDSEDVYIPVEGDVTSYAHSIGADSEPTGTFSRVSFEDEDGNQIASDLAEFRSDMGLSSRGSAIQAGRYRLVAAGSGTVIERDDSIPDVRDPVGRSNLVLSQPELGNVTTYTLPPAAANEVEQFDDDDEQAGIDDIGSLLDASTETDTVAAGDRILFEVQTVGMFGAAMDRGAKDNAAVNEDLDDTGEIPGERIQQLLDRHEGVHIELVDSELGGANRPGADFGFADADSSDLYVLPDDTDDQWDGDTVGDEPTIGGFYIIADTRGNGAFDGRPQDGDEYRFEIAYESPDGERYQYHDYSLADGEKPDPFDPDRSVGTDRLEHFPYFGSTVSTVSANSTFVFEEPYVGYDETTLDDELVVPAEAEGLIRGETNIAPGSQAEIQLVASNRPEPKRITIEDVEVTEDRRFEVTDDFSAFEPGERVEVEFYTQGRLIEDRIIDKRGVRVVENLDNPATFEITNHTESAEVTRGERLDEIKATITNTGSIADRQRVRFEVDGSGVKETTETLDSGENTTLDLSDNFVTLPAGDYSYTVRTDDDERSGQLTVTEADDETAEQLDADGDGTVETPPGETGGETPDGLFGLFGFQRRDVAVAAAVTGAMHILGQWI